MSLVLVLKAVLSECLHGECQSGECGGGGTGTVADCEFIEIVGRPLLLMCAVSVHPSEPEAGLGGSFTEACGP